MSTQQNTRYIPLAKFDKYHPWPTPQSMRNRIHAAKNHGEDPAFLDCVVRVHGRVLIDEQRFLHWLESAAGRETITPPEAA